MKIYGEKELATFIKRPNRFEALVEINGELEVVHVPNTGRMSEMLHEGVRVVVVKSKNPNRKTRYSMMFVYKGDNLICINSIYANNVFEEGIKSGKIDWLKGKVFREVTYGNSRLDFLIEGENRTFVEIKCCTYEENGTVMFPDAPTDRGRKHVDELIKAKSEGYGAAVVIMAFMNCAKDFTPNYKIDREFGEKLKFAYENGVKVKVYRCNVNLDNIEIDEEINLYF